MNNSPPNTPDNHHAVRRTELDVLALIRDEQHGGRLPWSGCPSRAPGRTAGRVASGPRPDRDRHMPTNAPCEQHLTVRLPESRPATTSTGSTIPSRPRSDASCARSRLMPTRSATASSLGSSGTETRHLRGSRRAQPDWRSRLRSFRSTSCPAPQGRRIGPRSTCWDPCREARRSHLPVERQHGATAVSLVGGAPLCAELGAEV